MPRDVQPSQREWRVVVTWPTVGRSVFEARDEARAHEMAASWKDHNVTVRVEHREVMPWLEHVHA